MSCLHYHNNQLTLENTPILNIINTVGTPAYLYSQTTLLNNYHTLTNAFNPQPHTICYAVKANSNLHLLRLLAEAGSGFDVVSLGELQRVITAGGDAQKTIFSGVAKTEFELREAIRLGVYCIDIESAAEFERLAHIAAEFSQPVNVAIRVNPNINAQTHAHISTGSYADKFGVPSSEVITLAKHIANTPALKLIGLAAHIGSQLTTLDPIIASVTHLLNLIDELAKLNIHLTHINIGGGLGITYRDETPPSFNAYGEAISTLLKNKNLKLILEPGRSLIANAGCLVTRIEYIKQTPEKNFLLVDAGMNDLIRPALYEAWHQILPVITSNAPTLQYDIAGPVCESADFLGKDRPLAVKAGDYLVVADAGAYGYSMSSNYNSRYRPVEVLVHNDDFRIIRRRETFADTIAMEA